MPSRDKFTRWKPKPRTPSAPCKYHIRERERGTNKENERERRDLKWGRKEPKQNQPRYAETSSIFELGSNGPNMCLENDYDNGREYISEHSDDERQFGQLHDVFCWITGPASRKGSVGWCLVVRISVTALPVSLNKIVYLGVFRVRALRGKVPAELTKLCPDPAHAQTSRDLFSINIPAGLSFFFFSLLSVLFFVCVSFFFFFFWLRSNRNHPTTSTSTLRL